MRDIEGKWILAKSALSVNTHSGLAYRNPRDSAGLCQWNLTETKGEGAVSEIDALAFQNVKVAVGEDGEGRVPAVPKQGFALGLGWLPNPDNYSQSEGQK